VGFLWLPLRIGNIRQHSGGLGRRLFPDQPTSLLSHVFSGGYSNPAKRKHDIQLLEHEIPF